MGCLVALVIVAIFSGIFLGIMLDILIKLAGVILLIAVIVFGIRLIRRGWS